ncbi:MAG: hypothetical protein R3Y11_04085 [Pseudomonadota bacterium]
MTFQVKIVPNSSVQASSDVSLASTDVMAPDTRDVEAFAGMMEQGSKPHEFGATLAQSAGNGSVAYADDAAELPSPATLLSASSLTTSAQNIATPQSNTVAPAVSPENFMAAHVGQTPQDIATPIMSPDTLAQQGLSSLQADGTLSKKSSTTVSPAAQPSSALLDDDLAMQTAGALGVQPAVQSVNTQTTPSAQTTQDSDAPVYLNDSDANAYTASLLASMNSLLQASSLQTSVTTVVTETTTVSAPHFTAKEIDAMVTMLVERIAVTDTTAHMVTVEVSLADTALRGTMVQLTRSLDGLLAVNVMTNDAASFQTLVGAQVDLRVKLEALEIGTVRVDITHMAQEQESNPQRRSATYQVYSGDGDEQA